MMFVVLFLVVGLVVQDYFQLDFIYFEGIFWCFELEIMGELQDCVLLFVNDIFVMFIYMMDVVEDEWGNLLVCVDVIYYVFDGMLFQFFSELVDWIYVVLEVIDINNDGVEEILILIYMGNVNMVWQVWYQVDDVFVDVGEVSGLGLEYDEMLGLLSILLCGSVLIWYWMVWYFDLVGLVLVYELVMDLGMESCLIEEGLVMQEIF